MRDCGKKKQRTNQNLCHWHERRRHCLVDDMAGITGRMDASQEIAGELQRQTDVFANL